MIGDTRRCLHCNTDAIVIQSRPMNDTELCTLDCSHVCAYRREGGNMKRAGFTDTACPCCNQPFRSYIQGVFGKICSDCKQNFGIRNSVEAQEMLDALEGDSAEEFKAMAKQGRAAPRCVVQGAFERTPHRPPMDPARVADLARLATDYGVLGPLPDSLPKPTTYAIAKNGLFEVRDNDVARIVIQPKDVVGLTESLTPGMTLHVPKVPYEMLKQTVAFFSEVCTRQKGSSEALVQIWWNRASREYRVHVPEQSVSGGGVDHRSEFDKENERDAEGASIWLHVMDIHSHGSSMSGFWSGTDDADEKKAPEGRMFGVIGKVAQAMPDWRWRMRTREGFIDLRLTDVFDVSVDTDVPFTVPWRVLLDASMEKDGISADGRVKLLCPVDPFKDATCPPAWHEQVKARSWSGGSYFTGTPHHNTVPMYIFIETKDNLLEEFLVDADSSAPPKPTGRKIIWKSGEDR